MDDFESGIDFSKPQGRYSRTRKVSRPVPEDETYEAEVAYLDPAKVAIDLLSDALPEFRSRMHPQTDSIRIDGALPIASHVSADPRYWVVRRRLAIDGKESTLARALREVTEDKMARVSRLTKGRLQIEDEVSGVVMEVVHQLQMFAIKAVSLESVIEERELRAFEKGKRAGYLDGKDAGAREARAELLADAQEARDRIAQVQAILAGEDPDA